MLENYVWQAAGYVCQCNAHLKGLLDWEQILWWPTFSVLQCM